MKITPVAIRIMPFIETHKEIEYFRNGKWVKRKVKLKEPEAHFKASFELETDEPLCLGALYADDKDYKWVCTQVHFNTSILRNVLAYLPTDVFYLPSSLVLLGKSAFEH